MLTAAGPGSCLSLPSQVRDSTAPLKQWPAGHLIMTPSTGPSVASRALSGPADPHRGAGPDPAAHAAFLAGDLVEEDRQDPLAVELGRTAAAWEKLALAASTPWSISAITGAGIQPATRPGSRRP